MGRLQILYDQDEDVSHNEMIEKLDKLLTKNKSLVSNLKTEPRFHRRDTEAKSEENA